jgi:hypothetical protein
VPRTDPGAGAAPLTPERAWRAITIATVVLVPAFWMILVGVVSSASDAGGGVDEPAAFVAFGIALVPFVFIALAFLSGHPSAPGAVGRAMGLCALIGIVVWAVAGDPVTGIVAGVGAGGVAALRPSSSGTRRARVVAVAVATVYVFVLAHLAGAIVLLPAPIFPFTALGLADQLAERRASRVEPARTR